MQKIILVILLATSLFGKDIIAVLDLEPIGLSKEEAKILTQRLTTKLVSIGKYQVVERNNMDKILSEQKFQHSGCTDNECAVEIGQLLNTDFIVIGNVSKFGSTWLIDARLINVGQGNVLVGAEYSIDGKMEQLVTTGINSIAEQLCGIEVSKSRTTYNQINNPTLNRMKKQDRQQNDRKNKIQTYNTKNRKGKWYFSFFNFGYRMNFTNDASDNISNTIEIPGEGLHIRYKNLQWKYTSTTFPDIDGYHLNASGIGCRFKRNINIGKVKTMGFNAWWFYHHVIKFKDDTMGQIELDDYLKFTIDFERRIFTGIGTRLETGLTFPYSDSAGGDIEFFIQLQLNILTFGSNY